MRVTVCTRVGMEAEESDKTFQSASDTPAGTCTVKKSLNGDCVFR